MFPSSVEIGQGGWKLRSLFLKIFLSFWLAMVLVSATLIASVVTTQSQFKAMRTEEFDRTVMPLMAARGGYSGRSRDGSAGGLSDVAADDAALASLPV